MSTLQRLVPQTVAAFPFASNTLAKVVRDLATGVQHDHLLLYGEPGTGKSLLVDLIFKDRHPVLAPIISRYKHEGVDWDKDTVSAILGEMACSLLSGVTHHHYTIVNEADLLTEKQKQELKAVMDKHQDHKFLLTTNHIHKFSPSFINRCSCFEVTFPKKADVAPIIQQVFLVHGQTATQTEIDQLYEASNGSWRTLDKLVASII